MTTEDRFKTEQVLEIVSNELEVNPNSSEFDFYLKLRDELIYKLKYNLVRDDKSKPFGCSIIRSLTEG